MKLIPIIAAISAVAFSQDRPAQTNHRVVILSARSYYYRIDQAPAATTYTWGGFAVYNVDEMSDQQPLLGYTVLTDPYSVDTNPTNRLSYVMSSLMNQGYRVSSQLGDSYNLTVTMVK